MFQRFAAHQLGRCPLGNHLAPAQRDELDRLGFDGIVGCEYRPRGVTADGLGWFAPYKGARA